MKKEKENKMKEEPKKEKSKKGFIIALSILLSIVLIVAIVFIVMYFLKPKYEVKVNSGGGTITRDIVIDDNVIKELPKITPPKNKVLVTWVNEKNEAVRPNLKIEDDMELTPVFEDKNRTTVTLKFVTYTSEKIPDIVITKGSTVILPVKPSHSEWKFLYWIDKDGYIVLKDRRITEDTTIYAYWFKPQKNVDPEEYTIKYETGTDEKINDIKLVKGSNLIFPSLTKTKEGMVFRGWLDEDGNAVTNKTIVTKNMTLKVNWKTPYTCPNDCTPSQDGKTCTKTSIVEPTKETVCPGTEYRGYCLDFNNKDDSHTRQCAAMGNDESDEIWYNEHDEDWCVPKIAREERNTCPEGYDRDGDKCKKVETIECQAN